MGGAQVAALCAEAESAMLAGDAPRAAELLERALAAAEDPDSRTDVLCLRARLTSLTGARGAVTDELRAQAAALAETRPDLAARLLADAVILLLWDRHPDIVPVALQAHALAPGSDPLARAQADAVLGLAYVFTGDPASAAPFLATSAQMIRLGGPPQQVVHLVQHIIVGLSGVERYVDSMALCRQYVGAVRSVGAEGLLPYMLCLLSNTAYFTSEFDAMEMAAHEALGLATALGQAPVVMFANVCLALVLAVRGDAAAAQRSADTATAEIARTGSHTFTATVDIARGLSALSSGDWLEAVSCYQRISDFLDETAPVSGILHWRADQIEALWRSGDAAAARARLAELRAGLDREGPWEQATAARSEALLCGGEQADEWFAEAMRRHAQSPSTFERARTELCWGESLAARGRDTEAAMHLETARAEFVRLGARPWAERAGFLLAGIEPVTAAAGTETGTTLDPVVLDAPVQVRGFGPLTLVRGGVEMPVAMDTAGRALRSLVASGGSVHVEQLIEELWPDAPAEQGSPRLRTVLSRTRARYGPLLVRDGSVIRWADGVSVDVQRFAELAREALSGRRDAAAVATAREAVRLYSAELLPLDRYSDWTVSARERLRQRYLALLDLLTDDAVDRGDLRAAIGYAREAVDAAPLDEDGYLRLARLMLDDGRPGQAREVVGRAKAAAVELGLAPSAALVALERRVNSAGS